MELDPDSRKQLEQLLMVDPGFLTAARDEMITLSGSVDTYVREYAGIGDDVQQTLGRQLLC